MFHCPVAAGDGNADEYADDVRDPGEPNDTPKRPLLYYNKQQTRD
jgi:hypothetical protein